MRVKLVVYMQRSCDSDCKRKHVVISINDFRNSSIWLVKLTGVSAGNLEFAKHLERSYGISIGDFTNSDNVTIGDHHRISRMFLPRAMKQWL